MQVGRTAFSWWAVRNEGRTRVRNFQRIFAWHHGEGAAMATILVGPACYLTGTALFKWSTNERPMPPLSHVAGLLMLGALALAVVPLHLTPLMAGVGTTVVLAIVATWESLALRRA